MTTKAEQAPMTEDKLIELGKRALDCRHWRWMPGMAWILPPSARASWPARLHNGRYPIPKGIVPIPDFNDPATRGCLLSLVREATGLMAYAEPEYIEAGEPNSLPESEEQLESGIYWFIWNVEDGVPVWERSTSLSNGYPRSEIEALVDALEAAHSQEDL